MSFSASIRLFSTALLIASLCGIHSLGKPLAQSRAASTRRGISNATESAGPSAATQIQEKAAVRRRCLDTARNQASINFQANVRLRRQRGHQLMTRHIVPSPETVLVRRTLSSTDPESNTHGDASQGSSRAGEPHLPSPPGIQEKHSDTGADRPSNTDRKGSVGMKTLFAPRIDSDFSL